MVKLGRAFPDSLSFYKKRVSGFSKQGLRGWGARITLLYALLLIFFFFLLIRLFHLTIIKGQENRVLSEANRIRSATMHAPRGILYDRRGVALVENIPAFRVTKLCANGEACGSKFMTEDEAKESNIDKQSIFLEKDFLRHYIYPNETAHVIGFLGEIIEEELNNILYNYQDYTSGDRLGRMGIEQVFEKKLRGIDGKELIEVDSHDNKIRTLGRLDAIGGQDLHLSLDVDLQKVAYEALGENKGAVVVSKPKTGEILVLVSTPSFDPNKIHTGISNTEFQKLVKNKEQPMFNRAISGVYPPGSTFKLIVSVAGLETGAITKDATIEDTGILILGNFSFANWYFTQYGKTEGLINMEKAIARSNDIYFYKLGERIGITKLSKWGKNFGLGSKTGIELNNEAEGLMPDPEYKKKVYHDDWYLGDSYHIAIGQGDILASPLQVNRWTNIIASGGKLCDFTLLKQNVNSNEKNKNCSDIGIKKDTVDVILEGMRRACSKGDDVGYPGTGYPLFDFTVTREMIVGNMGRSESNSVPIACKTGTAEFGDPNDKTHAWFTSFAPIPGQKGDNVISGDPEIVVTVLIEEGGEGSTVAAPIAKKIFEEWFKR